MRSFLTPFIIFCSVSTTHALAGSSYKSTLVSVPLISSGAQSTLHFEYNLMGEAGLALELTGINEHDDIQKKEAEETGDSLIVSGNAITILLSRYTNHYDMSGFYWTLGAGYRQQNAKWIVSPESNDEEQNALLLQEDDKFHHDVKMAGLTTNGRVGYRYNGSDWPIVVGSYIGVRHWENRAEDAASSSDAEEIAALTTKEKERLQRRFMTGSEFGVEFGMVF